MTSTRRRYVLVETLISVAFNGAISLAFTWLTFHASSAISAHALLIDAIPQSFMVALMSVVVPGILTARRLKSGRIAAIPSSSTPWPIGARALCAATIAVALGFALHMAVLDLWSPGVVSFSAVLAVKMGYGAALAAIVTPLMLRSALRSSARTDE